MSAEEEIHIKLHQINTHNASDSMFEKSMIQTFCNFLGRMISDSNEVVTKMIQDNSENVCKLMKKQETLEKSLENVQSDLKEIKSNGNKTEQSTVLEMIVNLLIWLRLKCLLTKIANQ